MNAEGTVTRQKSAVIRQPKVETREAWLRRAIEEEIGRRAKAAGLELPPILVSVGQPRRTQLGCCYARQHSAVGASHIFVSAELTDPITVLGVAAHEVAHAIDDLKHGNLKHGHRGPFRDYCRALGLEGGGPARRQFTATEWSVSGRRWAAGVVARLGRYPHDGLRPWQVVGDPEGDPQGDPAPGPGSRMLKVACPECGYFVRTTARRLREHGAPICPNCLVHLAWAGGRAGKPGVRGVADVLNQALGRLHGRSLRDFVGVVVRAHEPLVREVLAEIEAEGRGRLMTVGNRLVPALEIGGVGR